VKKELTQTRLTRALIHLVLISLGANVCHAAIGIDVADSSWTDGPPGKVTVKITGLDKDKAFGGQVKRGTDPIGVEAKLGDGTNTTRTIDITHKNATKKFEVDDIVEVAQNVGGVRTCKKAKLVVVDGMKKLELINGRAGVCSGVGACCQPPCGLSLDEFCLGNFGYYFGDDSEVAECDAVSCPATSAYSLAVFFVGLMACGIWILRGRRSDVGSKGSSSIKNPLAAPGG